MVVYIRAHCFVEVFSNGIPNTFIQTELLPQLFAINLYLFLRKKFWTLRKRAREVPRRPESCTKCLKLRHGDMVKIMELHGIITIIGSFARGMTLYREVSLRYTSRSLFCIIQNQFRLRTS
jgi:hypothetical protein